MRKLLWLPIAIGAVFTVYPQDIIVRDELYTTVTRMTDGVYSLMVKEAGVLAGTATSGEGLVLDPYPFRHTDLVAPDRPTGVRAVALDASTVGVYWLGATDDIRVIGYRVYRDGQYVGYVSETGYVDGALSARTGYVYAVESVDRSMNVSELSDPVYVVTLDPTTESSAPHFLAGPSVMYVTDTVAVIGLSADKAVTARLEYGTDSGYGSVVAVEDYLRDQVVTVTGLSANTCYHYRVTIDDYSPEGAVVSGDDSFYTLGAADVSPPGFTQGPETLYVSDTIAVIGYGTDEDSLGYVQYGKRSIYENQVDEAYYETEHYVTLYGLEPGRRYWYRVSVRDRSYNGPVSSMLKSFRTAWQADRRAPVILGRVNEEYVADRVAVIGWRTNEASDGVIRFGTSRGVYERQVGSELVSRRHQVVLLNLEPHTQYYFEVSSTDPSGNTVESREDSFRTLWQPDVRGPRVSRIDVVSTTTGATIRWETNELAQGKLVYGAAPGQYTGQRYDSQQSREHVVSLTGLVQDTRYYFQIVVQDPSGNVAQTMPMTFRTKDGRGEGHGGGPGGRDDGGGGWNPWGWGR
jgi:chitodextrinase